MQKPPSHPYPEFASKDTETSRRAFVETIEYNGSLNSAMPAATSATLGCASDRPELARLSQPCVSAARTRSFRGIVRQAK
jgi:hypothetical protein